MHLFSAWSNGDNGKPVPSNLWYKPRLVGNKIVDHADLIGACTNYIFIQNCLQSIAQRQLQDETRIWNDLYGRFDGNLATGTGHSN